MTLNVVIFMTSLDGVKSVHFKFNFKFKKAPDWLHRKSIIERVGQTKYPMVIIKLVNKINKN